MLAEWAARFRPSIGPRIVKAVAFAGVGTILSQFLRIAMSLVLTRLLLPEAFGLMSLVGVVNLVVLMLSDIGLRVAVVQHERGDDPDFLNTVWTIGIIRGFAICAGVFVVAGTVFAARWFGLLHQESAWGHPLLPALIAASGFAAIVSGFMSTNYFSAARHIDLQKPLAVDLGSQAGAAVVGIILAYFTGSIWSLVVSHFAGCIGLVLLSHLLLPGIRNKLRWEPAAVRDVIHQGRWIMVSSTTNVAYSNLDRIILGMLLGPAHLGFYSLALNLVGIFDGIWSKLVASIAFPKVSEAARSKVAGKVRSAVLASRGYLDLFLVVAAGGLFSAGPTIISFLYDHRYDAAGGITRILALSMLLSRYGVYSTVYAALGCAEWQAAVNMIKLVGLLIALPAGYYYWGFEGAFYAVALHGIVALPAIFYFNHRLGLNSWKHEVATLLLWPLGFAAGSLASVVLVRTFPTAF